MAGRPAEVRNGLIARNRVYWGWFGVGMLLRDEHGRELAEDEHGRELAEAFGR